MKKLFLAVTLFTLLISLAYFRLSQSDRSVFGIPVKSGSRQLSIDDINKACTKTVGKDGFGTFLVKHKLTLASQTGSILVNCRLRLASGISLAFENSHINTKKLIIVDVQPGSKPSILSISDSSLQSNSGGLQIRLKNRHSQVEISSSRLYYPLSVGVSVGLSGDEQASLTVTKSKLTSIGPSSEDIVLVSTGKANFTGNIFSLSSQERVALLIAPICQASNNIGGNTSCISS